MIVSGVDALVIAPADSKALVPVVKKALDAGIVVVNIDKPLRPAGAAGEEDRRALRRARQPQGCAAGRRVPGEATKAGDEVGIIEGVSTTTNAQQRTAGFKDAMDAAGMKIVSLQSGNWEIEKGNAVASAMLNEHPDLMRAARRQRQHGPRRGIGGARGGPRRAGEGGRLRQYPGDQADAQGWPGAGYCRPVRPRSRRCSVSRPRSSCLLGKPRNMRRTAWSRRLSSW
ncbi:substrate-binding domain-containing protein [Pseudomonas aeruginosa]